MIYVFSSLILTLRMNTGISMLLPSRHGKVEKVWNSKCYFYGKVYICAIKSFRKV